MVLETKDRTIEEGAHLRNGATLINSKPCSDGNGSIVLASWRRGVTREYITWFMNEDGHTFHGHYFSQLSSALMDFGKRS